MHSNNNTNGQNYNNNIQNQLLGQNVITKNSLNSQASMAATSANDNDQFTPDSDFVADFGSANIFNASELNNNNKINNNNKNNNHESHTLATTANTITNDNRHSEQQTNANANFADFEHNPIYNAAGKYRFYYS